MRLIAIGASTLSFGLCAVAPAQEVIIASLPFLGGQTAGPRCQIFGPPNEDRDVWCVEEFTTTQWTRITSLTCMGIVNPATFNNSVMDVHAAIFAGLPHEGRMVLESLPLQGRYTPPPPFGSGQFTTTFGQQWLRPGDYTIMWAPILPPTNALGIMWHQPGPHAVGGGVADSGLQFNPGGWWNFANHPYRLVPLTLEGTGRTGINFVLRGHRVACYADCDPGTGPGTLDVFDFLCFGNAFAAGETSACDCDTSTGWGICDVFDFLCFGNAFSAGCP